MNFARVPCAALALFFLAACTAPAPTAPTPAASTPGTTAANAVANQPGATPAAQPNATAASAGAPLTTSAGAPATNAAAPTGNAAAPAAGATSGTTAAAQPQNLPPLKLKVADGISPPAALPQSILSLAAQQGFFTREGLDVEIQGVNGTPTIISAMRAGDVDVGIINSSDVIKLQAAKTLEMRVIGSPNGRNFWMIVSRDTIATPTDLRQASYAISRVGSEDHALALTVLRAKGIDSSEMSFLALGMPTIRVQALIANQIQATTTTVGTWITIRNQPGVKVLVSPDEFWTTAPLMSNVSAVTTGVLRDKPEELRRFTRAMLLTARYYAQHKDEWVRDMGTLRPDIQPDDLSELWDQFPSAWAVNGQLNMDTLQKTSDYLYATDDFSSVPRIPTSDWVDTQFVDTALSQLGVYPGVDDPGRAPAPHG
jgi:NitT/TauT family transport system substrate-binding protein